MCRMEGSRELNSRAGVADGSVSLGIQRHMAAGCFVGGTLSQSPPTPTPSPSVAASSVEQLSQIIITVALKLWYCSDP